jgi:hypothetical protein
MDIHALLTITIEDKAFDFLDEVDLILVGSLTGLREQTKKTNMRDSKCHYNAKLN